jgi:type II secretory pathway pseudopilin PulG
MKSTFGQMGRGPLRPAIVIVIVLLLITAGVVLWSAGTREDRRAQAWRSLATLQYARAADEHAQVRAPAAYWLGDYDAVAGADPFLAANAAYRAAVRPGGDWRTVVGRLDGVVTQYAEVLRANPGHADAAYNYEFTVRYRAAVRARQQDVAPEDDARSSVTVHGAAGAPPDTSALKKFRVIIPMRPEERREAEEAGKSGRRIRKG